MIEQLGECWRALMDKVDDVEVQLALDRAYQRFCGLDRQAAEQLDVPSLLTLLGEDQRMALAELTYFRALRKGGEEDDETLGRLYLRALQLLTSIHSGEIAEARVHQTGVLLEGVGDALPEDDTVAALWFLVRGGAYDKAEDLLFSRLDSRPRAQAPLLLLEAGEAFYERLGTFPEKVLLAGGFSLEEVQQGRSALCHRRAAREDAAP